MRIILSLIALVFITSCAQKTTNKIAYEKGLTELLINYPNFSEGYEIVYNDYNQITEIIGLEDLSDGVIECKYNKLGKISMLEYYTNNKFAFHKEIEWASDSIHMIKIDSVNDTVTNFTKELFILNSEGNIAEIIRFIKNEEGDWKKRGSRYEFTWQDGNLIKSTCFVHNDVVAEDSVIAELESSETSMFDLDEISQSIIDEGYVVFYESTFTYDDKINPNTNTSITPILLPNKQNTSLNNPINVTKVYTNGDSIQSVYKYEYNESGYPVKANIDVTSNIEELPNVSFSKSFKY